MDFNALRTSIDRRALLKSTALLGAASLAGLRPSVAQSSPLLKVATRTIEVNKKAATVFQVSGPDGRSGIIAKEGDRLAGGLLNATSEPLQMHWHGQIKAPAEQDRARPGGGALAAGGIDEHDFALTPGTHWMHSHTLSEQQLLAAPLVTREADAGDALDVVVMLHDFSFRSPQEILTELGGSNAHSGHGVYARHGMPPAPPPAPSGHGAHAGHGASAARADHAGHGGGSGRTPQIVHANDVRYDAYLANDRTLDDPEIVRVDRGQRVRLRIINGATATGFIVSTPGLTTDCIAVDGTPCQTIRAAQYPLAQGQRLDLLASIPAAGGSFAVLAHVEAETFATGIVLATAGATIQRFPVRATKALPLLDLGFEARLRAKTTLRARRADRTYAILLGEEPGYRWTLNGRVHGEHEPLQARQGERVQMTFMNPTSMMHPMHLHGHHFQVIAIGGRPLQGAFRDTVIVPAHTPVTVAFDANLKGSWYLHCHHLYHMATGMMTELHVS